MYLRHIMESFLKAVSSFPAVIVTGARQTGKTTLCQTLLADTHRYVSLEEPDIRRFAMEDPRGFLATHPAPLILDEIQYAPELPSYLQGLIDRDRKKYGQYILTGSQNFLLMQQISQSLAGRAAVLSLHPLSFGEFQANHPEFSPTSLVSHEFVSNWILRGGYPELRERSDLDRKLWCSSYIRLYLERDVRQILQVENLNSFETFLRLCATRTAQILNLNDLARDAGISPPTARRWLSVLQASYQVYLLQPYHRNIGKRFVKSPKLYFADTALASYLMGIHEAEPLVHGPQFGALLETAAVMEYVKLLSFTNHSWGMYFIGMSEVEVDLFLTQGEAGILCEIKTSKTPNLFWEKGLLKIESLFAEHYRKYIFSLSQDEIHSSNGVHFLPWYQLATALAPQA